MDIRKVTIVFSKNKKNASLFYDIREAWFNKNYFLNCVYSIDGLLSFDNYQSAAIATRVINQYAELLYYMFWWFHGNKYFELALLKKYLQWSSWSTDLSLKLGSCVITNLFGLFLSKCRLSFSEKKTSFVRSLYDVFSVEWYWNSSNYNFKANSCKLVSFA